MVEAAHAKGGAPPDSSFWGLEPDAFGEIDIRRQSGGEDEDETLMLVCVAIDVRAWIGRKLAALRCHRTQMGSRNPLAWIGEEEARRLLGVEYFRRAPLDASVAESILEELGAPVPSQ